MLDERLLDAIYASTFDDGALQQALCGLARACHSRAAGVFRLGPSGLDWELGHGMPVGFMAQFAQHTSNDPRVAFALAQPALTVLDDSAPAMRKAMGASGMDALARRWDLPWTLAMLCAHEVDAAWALYVSRSAREGPADTMQRACFAAYARHFSRALQLRIQARKRMPKWRCAIDGEVACVARLSIDANACVRSMDSDALAMLHAAEGVSIQRGVLHLAAPSATARLHDLAAFLANAPRMGPIAADFHLPQTKPPGMLRLRLDAGTQLAYSSKRLLTVWLERRSQALLDVGAGRAPTQRQKEVLKLLAQGLPTSAIAAAMGIGEATVRTHIKHLLSLTDTHNRRACIVTARRCGWL